VTDYHYLVLKTTGETSDLSSPDPLWEGQVLFLGDPIQVIERVEPAEGLTGRVVCREPSGPVYELMLFTDKPWQHDRLDYWEGDKAAPPAEGTEIRWGHEMWRVETVGAAHKGGLAGRLNCRRA
jgi:hypothetical protein